MSASQEQKNHLRSHMMDSIYLLASYPWIIYWHCDYYQSMKKFKAEKEGGRINLFYFALHPYTLSFATLPNTQYILYLQKNLQILARFPPNGSLFFQQKQALFEIPDKITSFRVVSEKNLIYQWALYRTNITNQQSHEEFVQSVKIDLTQFWSDFITKGERFKRSEITFKKVRCQFSFLIAVGTQKQIDQDIRKPFLKHKQVNEQSKLPQLIKQGIKQFHPEEKSASSLNEKDSKNKNHKQSQQGYRSETIISINKANVQESPQYVMDLHKTFSYQVLPKDEIKPQTSQYMETPVKSISLAKKNEESGLESFVYSQLKLHLSLSEIEISQEIEQRIKDTDDIARSPIKQSNGISVVQQPSVHDELMAKYRKQKEGKITSSQILNKNGEIIVTPFYHHPKYYLIVIVIIAIFIGLVSLDPQSRPHHPEKPTPNIKNKKERVKIRKNPNKKGSE